MPINHTMLARIAPFAFYILMMIVSGIVGDLANYEVFDTRWLYGVRIAGTFGLLAYFWSSYSELKLTKRLTFVEICTAIFFGVVVFVLWINLKQGWMIFGDETPFNPSQADGAFNLSMIVMRIMGAALIVPVMEELFWRSFIMRWIDSINFTMQAPITVSFKALIISSLLFASEHTLWFAGLIAGLIYALLYMRTQNLWLSIIAHGVTNGILGIWVVNTQQWQYW